MKTRIVTISKTIRIQGIPEHPNKTKCENLLPTNDEVNNLLNSIDANAHVSVKQRLEKFRNDRKKPRAVLVTLVNEHETRITLAKSREFRNNLDERNIYMLPALTRDDAQKENQMLKKQRELLDGGVPKEKLKVRNLELYNDGVKVQLVVQNVPWLGGFFYILQLNTRSLVNIERRSKFMNAIINSDYNVLCLCETWLNDNIHDSELFFIDYKNYRSDRATIGVRNAHGGTLIAVKNTLISEKNKFHSTQLMCSV